MLPGDRVIVLRGTHASMIGVVAEVIPQVSARYHGEALVVFPATGDRAWIPLDHLHAEGGDE